METLVRIEGHRWAIEDSFETAKNELGLDYNETRSWHGWHRHVSLGMLAFAMLAAIRQKANGADPIKRGLANKVMAANPRVDAGDPPYRFTSGAKTHPACRCHRMAPLAMSPSSSSSTSPYRKKNATVMLGPVSV
jgi:hypothetical protein